VPAEQSVGPDEEASETPAGEQSCQLSAQRPVCPLERGTADPAAEHGHLVAEHHHVDGQVVAVARRHLEWLSDSEEAKVEGPQPHDAILRAATSVGRLPGPFAILRKSILTPAWVHQRKFEDQDPGRMPSRGIEG
jgi:hypothetical protein